MAEKQIVTKPQHGEAIGETEHGDQVRASNGLQAHLDDLTQRLNENLLGVAAWLPSYTVATVPASGDLPDPAEAWMIFVTDETGGPTPAFWDGSDWLRTLDNAVIA